MPILKVLVDPTIKTRFDRAARARGLSTAALLRMVAVAAIEQDEASPTVVEPDPKQSVTERMTIRMPRFLMNGAKEHAVSKGMTPSRWISALVQSNILRQPVMDDAELQGLRTSNRELAAIGRNINQIAKALNETFHETERVRLDRLAELSRAVEGNRMAIQSLVRASQNTWETAR